MAKLRSSILLLFALVLVLSACTAGKGGGAAQAGNGNNGAEAGSEAPYELTMAFFTFGSTPKDLKLVQDEISKITKEKINATVELMPISLGAWDQQRNLMLSSDEKLDLMVNDAKNVSAQAAKGQLLPLNELIEKYGQGIQGSMDPAFLHASEISGQIYGIPTVKDFASNGGLLIRKDLADKYGIDVAGIKDIDGLEAMMKDLKEKEPNLTLATGGTLVERLSFIDPLGDYLGVLMNGGAELKVVNLYETQEYADLLKKVYNWYNSGYILRGLATNKEGMYDLIKGNRIYGYLNRSKPGIEIQDSRLAGTPLVSAELTQPIVTTDNVTSIMWSIPRNSKNPEIAMKFLNLLYTDKDLVNLIDWGIEGKHYKKTGEGNIITYPEGVDASNSGYNMNQGWMFGNQFLSYVFEGDDPGIWEKMGKFNSTAVKSKALGFTFDSSSVKTEIAALSNVMSEYKNGLETGMLNPDENLPTFISRLKAAGIEKVIAEKQKQLDAWASK